jgi:hypothetical protein
MPSPGDRQLGVSGGAGSGLSAGASLRSRVLGWGNRRLGARVPCPSLPLQALGAFRSRHGHGSEGRSCRLSTGAGRVAGMVTERAAQRPPAASISAIRLARANLEISATRGDETQGRSGLFAPMQETTRTRPISTGISCLACHGRSTCGGNQRSIHGHLSSQSSCCAASAGRAGDDHADWVRHRR